MSAAYYSRDTWKRLYDELRRWLDTNGPATANQISKGLRLSKRQLTLLLREKPDWLVSPGSESPQKKYQSRQTLYASQGEHELGWCQTCGRKNFHVGYVGKAKCKSCEQTDCVHRKEPCVPTFDTSGINPFEPTNTKPGTEDRMAVYAARFEAEIPLKHDEDFYDDTEEPSAIYSPEWEEWDDD